ncbi:hypothetical protein COT75_01675 [Candidatus Beckwithbacteria bacterium CG10_big_fil_rev_8_21_14_0_10_34_10]|uniref:Glycosyltransferase family 4 protein n=1 Tax=Candidatus Beckwithbacteria bacterium CG10_big_fil_rev_8_21_14_0_10_34_10 TaxID=1974495 RepID=A0A2H0W9Q8_9BACT|nr:MAG: hypothetical protein COT75_01675 [Candidatus Beckwithbacteria bacterium CG10_big_fil_rev_8_21_14_0_10_34_10]
MKILVLIDAWYPFIGGAQIQIENLERILEKKSKVKYYLLHSPRANIIIRFLWSLWVIPQAWWLNRKEKFDLIHAHAYWSGVPGKILSLILKIPIVFTVHGSNLLDLKVRSLRAFLENIVLTRIKYDQVISVSSNYLQYRNVNKNITVISNGVEVENFDKVKVKKEKPFKILFVGRNDPVKGINYLRKAMKKVRKEFPHVRLIIITGGIKHEDLIREYKASHVFVLPSLSEGQPLTLLEAWAAKLPVIVTRVGENPKMVQNGINGYLVKPKDSSGLSKAILRVLKDKNRDILGQKGYNLVKEKYSWQKCAQKTHEIYKQLVKI